MIGQGPPVTISKNTSTSKKGSKEGNKEEEQQSSSGGTHSTTATQTPWTLGVHEHALHLWTRKNDRGYKVDFASAVTKRDTSPDTVPTKEPELQKLPHQTPQSSPSKLKDQTVRPKRRKLSSPPSTRKQKKFATVLPKNYSAKRIFSTPKPSSLGKGLTT